MRIKSSQLSPQASSLSSSSNEERRLLERKADDEFSEDRFSSDPLVHDISSSDEEGEKADKSTVEEISLIDFDPEPEKETKVLKENKREEEILFVDDDDDGGHPANDKNEAPLNNSFTSDYLSMSPTNKTCKGIEIHCFFIFYQSLYQSINQVLRLCLSRHGQIKLYVLLKLNKFI